MVALQLLQRKGCLPRGKSACSSRVLPSTLCKHENRVSLRPRAAADGAFYPEALDASGYAMAVAEPESDEMSVADIKVNQSTGCCFGRCRIRCVAWLGVQFAICSSNQNVLQFIVG
eukprot:GHRR01020588.1.p1 GENE.GHRR01020588.1~~GHRR01020588.1.p1  ORF type:complete len:116 (+),score=20.99 GHRR01020588.1:83-430(+)